MSTQTVGIVVVKGAAGGTAAYCAVARFDSIRAWFDAEAEGTEGAEAELGGKGDVPSPATGPAAGAVRGGAIVIEA